MIEGVHIKELKVVRNERGHLMEVQRNDEDIYPGFGQTRIASIKTTNEDRLQQTVLLPL